MSGAPGGPAGKGGGPVTEAAIALLAVAVVGALAPPFSLPRFVVPIAAVAAAWALGLVGTSSAPSSLRPLLPAVAFLLAAVPLAVLIDRTGYFTALASLVDRGGWLVPGLWLVAAATVALLNLDAAVVLLTPLYLRIAERHRVAPFSLACQPVLLALFASSFLPVSNLTNLIVVARLSVSVAALAAHLALPGVAACAVGYWCYRRAVPVTEAPESPPPPQPVEPGVRGDDPTGSGRLLAAVSVLLAGVLAGFVLGPAVGLQPYEVALVADLVLVVATRRLPLRSAPWRTALLVLALGLLAGSVASRVHLGAALGGSGLLAELRQGAVAAVGANLLDNLPALLVALPSTAGPHGHASCALWPVLLGVNAGPGLLVTGSLASLLWFDLMHRLGAPVTARDFSRLGLRVVLPAAAIALGVLVACSPLLGCG